MAHFDLRDLKAILPPERYAEVERAYKLASEGALPHEIAPVDLTIPRPEEALDEQLRDAGIDGYVRQYRFAPPRRFKADFAFPEHRFLVEVEGGLFRHANAVGCPECGRIDAGDHRSYRGFLKDLEKYNLAALKGWLLVRVTTQQVYKGEALALIQTMLNR